MRSNERKPGVAAETITGVAQLVLTASVSRRYDLDRKRKIDIADEFKLGDSGWRLLQTPAKRGGPGRASSTTTLPATPDVPQRLADLAASSDGGVLVTNGVPPALATRLAGDLR